MDISKVNAAIDKAHEELNAVTDAAFKSRNVAGLRSLTLASKNLETAQTHLKTAVVQSAPKAPKAAAATAKK